MATFCMIGKYNKNSLEHASADRTREAKNLIARYQGSIKSMYALLGQSDLIMIVDLPSVEDALKVSVSLTKLTGISFTTSPAVSVDDFDIFNEVET